MRKNNIVALLNHADNNLNGIEQQYKEALSKKDIPTSLSIDIKNFMENLRSALDYMAHDIYEVVIKPERDKTEVKAIENIYFPYGKTENDFKSGIRSSLPDLQSLNQNIFTLIESIQPHKCNNIWLYDFCRIVNEKKHDKLSPQIKTKSKTMTASAYNTNMTIPINNPSFSVHQGQNGQITFAGVPIKLSDQGIKPLAPGLEITTMTWVSFQFADTKIQVQQLLKRALKEITTLSNKIYKELG